MNWDRALQLQWMQISVQKSVDIYNFIYIMKLLEYVLKANTHRYKNHYQGNEHNWKINMSNMKRGGPINNNNVFIILLGDQTVGTTIICCLLIDSYNYLAIFFFFFLICNKNLLKSKDLYPFKQSSQKPFKELQAKM